MKRFFTFPVLAVVGLLCACGRNSAIPSASTSGFTDVLSPQTISTHGNFSEYTLPAGVFPFDLTRGPYSTLWFPSASNNVFNSPAQIVELVTSTGTTHVFTAGKVPSGDPFLPPQQIVNAQSAVISVGGGIFYVGDDPDTQNEVWALRVTPQGAFTYKDMRLADAGATNFALGADGNLWFGFCTFSDCTDGGVVSAISTTGFITGDFSNDPRLDNGFCPNWVQSGPLNDIYTTSDDCAAAPPTGAARVYVNTTAGTIVHRFGLPTGSHPGRLVKGSDGNLWILEPGINKIARMTAAGAVTQFVMRTPNAGLSGITPGQDGALWFTENATNKLGRITTGGAITEYVIPTANSGPNGITPCTTACPPHGGVWFTETKANKIGKFNSPL